MSMIKRPKMPIKLFFIIIGTFCVIAMRSMTMPMNSNASSNNVSERMRMIKSRGVIRIDRRFQFDAEDLEKLARELDTQKARLDYFIGEENINDQKDV